MKYTHSPYFGAMTAALLWFSLFPHNAAGQAVRKCSDLTGFATSGVALSDLNATLVAASAPGTLRMSPAAPDTVKVALPAFCRLDGVIDRRVGSDGVTYGIGFAIALPENWNGRFLFQGGGGLNGTVGFPLGAVAAGDLPALTRGFAVVSTDTGHKGSVFDGSFMRDQQAALDFAYQAIGRVAVLAKQVIAFYYGKGAHHSYYAGCSTGGREAMIMSQRYPSYFEGIISGAPAMRTGHSNLALAFLGATFGKASPPDAAGKQDARMLLSDADRELVVNAVLAKCDEKDGLKDGMIFNQSACDFDPTTLICSGGRTQGCLTAAQATAIRTGFAGPKTTAGDPVYSGFPYDAGIAEKRGLPGLLMGPSIPVRGATSGSTEFNVDHEANRIDRDANGRLGDSTWTNLSTFAGHGGKLLFFHGVSDPWFSALETLDYYKKMSKDTPRPAAEAWSRFYFVPGMGHCGGGSAALDKFDLLTPLVDWVEKNQSPQPPVATGAAFPGRSRPLCAYPEHTHYKGSGDVNDASNFTCQK